MARPVRANVPHRRPKYGNTAAVGADGFKYDSKAECRRGDALLALQAAGEIRMVLRQVPFYLPDKAKLTLDFVWIENDGTMHFEDTKSPATAKETAFRLRKRLVEHLYDIEIEFTPKGKR